jgi:hypothetical protein
MKLKKLLIIYLIIYSTFEKKLNAQEKTWTISNGNEQDGAFTISTMISSHF